MAKNLKCNRPTASNDRGKPPELWHALRSGIRDPAPRDVAPP